MRRLQNGSEWNHYHREVNTMAKKETKSNALQELKADLKNKSLQRLYFFHGEETFLL